jgi:cell division septal protein FtsQ
MTEEKRQSVRSRAPEERASPADQASKRQRVVTTPDEVPPMAGDRYVQRRNQLYSARARRQTYTHLTPRTLAQTGVPASSGQMRAVKRLPRYHPSPIPVRSGRRGRGRNVLWRLLALFTLLALVGLGANFALSGAAFRISQVSIVGTHNTLLVQAIQHMGIQGQNIFLIDVAAVSARIELLPMVASARLEKQWPDRLQVVISERIPAILWQASNSTFGIDKNGVVLAPALQSASASTLRTVVDMSKRAGAAALRPGSRLPTSDIAFALAVFEKLPQAAGTTDFVLNYTAAAGRGDGAYIVASKAGWVAYLGGADDANPLDNRLVELQQILLLAQQQQLNLATIDLRFGFRPVYTLKKM